MATKKTTQEVTLEDLQTQLERLEDRISDLEADNGQESAEISKRLEKVEKLAQELLNSIRMG